MRLQYVLIKRLACAALMIIAGGSQAALTVFTSQASFLGAVTSPGVDAFNGFSTTQATPSPMNRAAGPYTYVAAASDGFFGAGSVANPSLSTNTASDQITFSGFGGGVSAIGGNFFGTDVNGAFLSGGTITLRATDSFGAISTQNVVNAGVTSFLGFVSTGTLTSLVVSAVQPVNSFTWPTIDNLTLAQAAGPIPEPETYAIML